jgi:fermentation-respiration switch protein FrsA (DUF1100 family)
MKYKAIVFLISLIATLAGPGCISQPSSESNNSQQNDANDKNVEGIKDIEGLWIGKLKVRSGVELRILFNISTGTDGFISATMDSLDQGAKGIPVDRVTYKDRSLKLEVKAINGVFNGTLKGDGKTIDGKWRQAGSEFPLVLNRTDKAPDLRRKQDPVKPYPYIEEEVTYENKAAGVKLAGTLTLPRSEGQFPVVILITGSGMQNRDEEVFGHRPFLVLADNLTRRGIAVLRVDDRGVGVSTGNSFQATSEDFAGDVLAGVEYLKSRKEIDTTRIGLIGHSEGGIIAPITAVKSPDVAFIVMMAGTGLTGEEIIYMQSALINRAEGASNETIARNEVLTKKIFSIVKEEQNNTVAEEELSKLLKAEMANMSVEEKKLSDYSEANLDIQIKAISSPWMRFFLTYDPKPTLMKVKCPVLAINGEKDLQVPPEENLRAIEAALKAGGNRDYTIKEMPGLNHVFQTAQKGSPSEYAKIDETISPAALEFIGNWILEHAEKTEK